LRKRHSRVRSNFLAAASIVLICSRFIKLSSASIRSLPSLPLHFAFAPPRRRTPKRIVIPGTCLRASAIASSFQRYGLALLIEKNANNSESTRVWCSAIFFSAFGSKGVGSSPTKGMLSGVTSTPVYLRSGFLLALLRRAFAIAHLAKHRERAETGGAAGLSDGRPIRAVPAYRLYARPELAEFASDTPSSGRLALNSFSIRLE